MKQLRASLYFSRRKDLDIINELRFEDLEQGDINWVVKELMRDGIKYRRSNGRVIHEPPYTSMTAPVKNYNEPTIDVDMIFDDIEIVRKELDEDDIASRLGEI